MNLVIRPAQASDRADARALLVAQLEEHALPPAPVDGALSGALEDPSRATVLLARDGERAIGVAYVAFIWTLEHGGRAAWLEELFVVPELRGQGVGGALLKAALDLARDRECLAVDLEVESDHARAANLYVRAGFHAHTRARYVKKLREA
jgi:GNAT superfamily N-acetyltransferase